MTVSVPCTRRSTHAPIDQRRLGSAVIKASRSDIKAGKPKKGGSAEQKKEALGKAVKAKNKAQRSNKVNSARGMEVDTVPVPSIKTGVSKAIKKKTKVKAKNPVKVKVGAVSVPTSNVAQHLEKLVDAQKMISTTRNTSSPSQSC